MKNTFLLAGCLLFVVASGCANKKSDPEPHSTQKAAQLTSSTYLNFRLVDAADSEQFNTAVNARVYYFPQAWTDSQIKSYFGNPATNESWNDRPRLADGEYDFDNVVAPGYGWSASPGLIKLDLTPAQKVVVIFAFVDAKPECRRSYRQQFFLWNGLGENYTLTTDRLRAGL